MKKTPDATKDKILSTSIPLFAKDGYDKVSMRQIADSVGIKASSLYYHFSNKEALYLEALTQAFSRYATFINNPSNREPPPLKRLEQLLLQLCTLVHSDTDFRILMQRELLSGNKERLKQLAEMLFGSFFSFVSKLSLELTPDKDPHLVSVSILSMVIYHYQIDPIRSFFEGYDESQNEPSVVAAHIYNLLTSSLVQQNG